MKSSKVELQLCLAIVLCLLACTPLFAAAPTLNSISPKSAPLNTAVTLQLVGANFASNSQVYFNGNAVPTTFSSTTVLQASVPAASVATPGNFAVTVTTPSMGTSAALMFTSYVALPNNSMAYSAATGQLYVSVPSTAGMPYGNSVVAIDPVTGAITKSIFVGSEPNKMAVSADGTVLWVGLDGSSAVRQVSLTAGTAGAKITLGSNTGTNAPPVALSLAALPGSPNSFVVSMTAPLGGTVVAIYDNATRRANTWSASTYSGNALQTNATTSEVYVGGPTYYQPLSYSATGLSVPRLGSSGNFTGSTDDLQVVNGEVYTDLGALYDAETGARNGSLLNGSNLAAGPTFTDTPLGKTFVFDSPTANKYTQVQVFTTSTSALAATFPLNLASNTTGTPSHLLRWGTNGLAVRDNVAIYAFRSAQVTNLAGINADLSVTLAQSGTPTTGNSITYTATVKNAGPATSTNVAFTAQAPATASIVSITPTVGSCSKLNGLSCNLGSLATGATTTVTVVAKQMLAGSVVLNAQVFGSENDPNLANNQASTSVLTITGNPYNGVPTITSISPAAIQAGSGTTMVTVTGTGFSTAASILIDGTALATTVLSSTQATAMVPSTKLASLGWSKINVSNPAPGGGVSYVLPLSVFKVLSAGANHIVYEPFSRKLIASIGAGGSGFTANSVTTIIPDTATVGTTMLLGAAPTSLAVTSDGQALYATLPSVPSVARFNLLAQKLDFTYTVPKGSSFTGTINLRGVSTQPGNVNTVALDLGASNGIGIYDFNSTTKTAALRGSNTGNYTGSCVRYSDSTNLMAFDSDSNLTFNHFAVPAAGFAYSNPTQYSTWSLASFNCFQMNGGYAFANKGGAAIPVSAATTEVGVFKPIPNVTTSTMQVVAPDVSLHVVFYLAQTHSLSSTSAVDGLVTYNQTTYMPNTTIPMGLDLIENTTSFGGVDLVRWGQDGLAALTSTGKIYLLRGGAVVPQLLSTRTAATLTSASVTSVTHGSGNLLISVVGTNFQSGMVLTWNGNYRTTNVTDATHATVAIPASDFASIGAGTITAVNAGAPASSGLSITIN
ncbi:Protein of unknown function DUF11 [Candidatus Koribacter versatilis Ellin345]|uniref:DUF11 domain-containing protein n=1 Tax=Koribacter versatilis (strain Ellin345) TaxID=204669 RepID=Q1IUW3_KORVE|nr:IPT/TIG domain-containing protein [Candidatus Koribacter versatilis]ABF39337.1 Protein of unknown function DUF11 [Candidatus Koribacter versatilis Ellin345]